MFFPSPNSSHPPYMRLQKKGKKKNPSKRKPKPTGKWLIRQWKMPQTKQNKKAHKNTTELVLRWLTSQRKLAHPQTARQAARQSAHARPASSAHVTGTAPFPNMAAPSGMNCTWERAGNSASQSSVCEALSTPCCSRIFSCLPEAFGGSVPVGSHEDQAAFPQDGEHLPGERGSRAGTRAGSGAAGPPASACLPLIAWLLSLQSRGKAATPRPGLRPKWETLPL